MKKLLNTTTAISLLLATPAFAGWNPLKDIVNIVEDTTKAAAGVVEDTVTQVVDITGDIVHAVPAVTGLKTLEDVLIEGKSLDDSLNESLEDIKASVVAAATVPTILIPSLEGVTEITGAVLGEDAAAVVGLILLPAKIAVNLPAALAEQAVSISENIDNAENVVGLPLHAALKQVQQYYEGQGSPLPPKVQTLLSGTFGKEFLSGLRYVVDDGTGNLASLINAMQTQFGNAQDGNHAVTVGNLIIFDREPNDGLGDIAFWAHEVQHTVQYKDIGIDGFAAKYTTEYQSLEEDAYNVSVLAVENIRVLLSALQG